MSIIRWACAIACAAVLSCAARPALAQQHAVTSAAPAGFAPETACTTWSGGAIGAGGLVPCSNGNGATRTFAPAGGSSESSSAASYTFSPTSQQLARGWYANCPANTAVVVTLIGVNGGTAPRTLYDGWQDNDDRLASFSGNTAGCTIGERF